MDRVIVYDGALPQTTDVLNAGKFGMVGQAYQNLALLGSATVVAGLACLPTSPTPDLHVSIGVGSIYQLDPTDAAAYGDLGVDNNNIMKQGILAAPVILTITPPATPGFSQVYLVQAALADVDGGQLVLSYYNSLNPALPFAGPAGSGSSNFTTRTCPCVISLKAGAAATTGTQTTPSPDPGFVGLYAITVANGATQVTGGQILQLPTAPFFPTLPSVPGRVRDGSWIYAQDTGTVNAMVITLGPPASIPTAYVAGMGLRVKVLNTITSTTVNINVNGLGNVRIKRASGADPVFTPTPDLTSGMVVDLVYDGVNFQIANYLGVATGAVTNNFNAVGAPYVVDSGAVNAIVATFSPVITSGQQVAGLLIAVKLANTITGACTINVNGLGLKSVKTGDVQNPPNGVYVTGEVLLLIYDGTQYQIVNTSSLTYRKPSANLTIFVNGAIGNDANDGVSNTSGHALATIQGGVNLAFSYAPSQFVITIVVEPGTYVEQVSTPPYAGPAIVIDGLVATSVIVNPGAGYPFTVQGANIMTVKNLTAANNGAYPFHCFGATTSGAILVTQNCITGTTYIVWFAGYGGEVQPGTHTISGSAGGAVYWAIGNGVIFVPASITHTFSTPVSVGEVVAASAGGNVTFTNVNPVTFVNPGFVSGLKYNLGLNGTLNQTGLGANFLPGSGFFTQTGGQAQV
jgi:hypothetical protein